MAWAFEDSSGKNYITGSIVGHSPAMQGKTDLKRKGHSEIVPSSNEIVAKQGRQDGSPGCSIRRSSHRDSGESAWQKRVGARFVELV